MPTTAARPLKRLSRPEVLPPLRLTDRALRHIEAVARLGTATSDQLARIDGGSHQQNLRLLFKLWAHGYLERPHNQHAQLVAFFDEGNRPLCYRLGPAGARLLAERGHSVNPKIDFRQRSRRVSAVFLAHSIETAEAMISFGFACRSIPKVRLLDHHELIPLMPARTRRRKDPFHCRVSVTLPGRFEPLTIGVVPDRLFRIIDAQDVVHNCALELDRGTMDIKARRLTGKSSFFRKLIGYNELWHSKLYSEQWGFTSFRVLTITPSEKRLEHMIDAQEELDAAPGLFLYATPERIAEFGPLGRAWVNGRGETISLIGESSRE